MSTIKLFMIIILINIFNPQISNKVNDLSRKVIRNLETVSNKIILYFNNVSDKTFLFTCSFLSTGCSNDSYKVTMLQDDGTNSQEITESLLIVNITCKNGNTFKGVYFSFSTTVSSPKILIELLINPNDLRYFFHESIANKIEFGENFVTTSSSVERMFNSCKDLTSIDFNNFDTSGITNMKYFFNESINKRSRKIT